MEVVSPLVLPEAKTTAVSHMLAGEFLFHFGGFLAERLRQSDFDLGYRSTLEWLKAGGLRDHGLDHDAPRRGLRPGRGRLPAARGLAEARRDRAQRSSVG